MDAASKQYLVPSCSMCPGDAEYFCASCSCDLCLNCRDNHVNNLKTIDHNVVIRKKYNFMPIQELCITHPGKAYKKYCERCELPVCNRCRKQRNHRQVVLKKAYKSKVKQYKAVIHTIRCDTLFSRYVLQGRIKAEVKTVQTCFSLCQSELSAKAETLKNIVKYVLFDLLNNVFCDFDFKHRCLKQKFELSRRLARIQRYEYRYEQSATCSVITGLWKKIVIPKICQTSKANTSKLSVTDLLHKTGVIDTLCKIEIGGGKRYMGNACLLKLMPSPELHQTITLKNADGCKHITFMTSDQIWVSDKNNNIMLTNKTGVSDRKNNITLTATSSDTMQRQKNFLSNFYKGFGLHIVNREGEFVYIDRENNINKLARNLKTITTFIKLTDKIQLPQCVYCSPLTGDLLVAAFIVNTRSFLPSSVVKRYNQSGQLTQTIQHDSKGMNLFRKPCITENNNGNIVVSDLTSVVVTEAGGSHRFSYTGISSGLELWPIGTCTESQPRSIHDILVPIGICTDALSHILVCDETTNTVQIINSDGQFLSYLLIRPSGIFFPRSLSYDVNTHRLWVGSPWFKNMCCFRYMTRQTVQTGRLIITHLFSRSFDLENYIFKISFARVSHMNHYLSKSLLLLQRLG
ncbi:uncharacterized protein LOC128170687 isoform X1 [Crassostrea angulata]|uniref:uncharacterized protein LOC128170687 isoform X1 n=1 Tax=Magallana angulata TaxID=2784310 RepID=UPI0022B175DB|nr:uncharacterized protein LOC128170687 isoform X1 [Crassostrea angulata]